MDNALRQMSGISDDDYDYEGYIKEFGEPDQSKGQHLTDKYKKPNHITFSDESIHSNKDQKGGKWSKENDKWHFYPSEHNLKTHTEEELSNYFKNKEKDAVLHLPKKESK